MARAFSPDELFAAVDERMERTGYLARRAGRHVTPPTPAEAAEMLKRQPGKQGVKDYDGINADLQMRQERARRSGLWGPS